MDNCALTPIIHVQNMNELPKYPEAFEEALEKIANQRQLKLLRYEYWGVPIRTLQWVNNRVLKSIQFDFRDNDIGVYLKKEQTGGLYSFYRWCHNNVPMFPYLLKNTELEKPPLTKESSIETYLSQLESLIENNV